MKKCILTVINIEFIEIFEKFLYFYEKNCNFDLLVITLNFEYQNNKNSKIKYIPYFDKNIYEFEKLGDNSYIKSFSDKYKYITGLKPKLVNFSLLFDYDLFFFIDADCLITVNFNNFYNKYNEKLNGYPICPNYSYEFMVYKGFGSPYSIDQKQYDESLCLEGQLVKFLNLDCKRTTYRTTFCYIYDKTCASFFEEANKIIFEMDLFKDKNKYFPLLDETVFNVLFWKYNYKQSLNILPCADFNSVFKNDLDVFKNFKNKNKLALVHVKFYKTNFEADSLVNFKNVDHEKYLFFEKLFEQPSDSGLFYFFDQNSNQLHVTFNFLNSQKASILAHSSNSYFSYIQSCCDYGSSLSYFIIIYRNINEKINLIFKDENDNILYYIDEIFNN